MKKTLLTFIVGLLASVTLAQTGSDPTYGFGTVPVQDGKVTFVREIACNGYDLSTAFKTVSAFMKGRYVKPIVLSGRISESDTDMSIRATEKLTFKKTALVTDETEISYTLSVKIADEKCILTFTDIAYSYEEEREGSGMHFTAEEWITDEEAFNRSGSKLLKMTGKFRIKTIDMVNDIAKQVEDAINSQQADK